MTELAAMRQDVTIVPFYDSLGAQALVFVLNQTNVTTMCLEKTNFDLLLKIKDQAPNLKNIVIFDADLPEEKKKKAEDLGLKVYQFYDVVKAGQECQ